MWSQMIETLLYHQFLEMVKFCPKGQFDTGYANCRNNVDTGCANCKNMLIQDVLTVEIIM